MDLHPMCFVTSSLDTPRRRRRIEFLALKPWTDSPSLMPRDERYLMSLACTVEARRGALRMPPFWDVGRKRKPQERSRRIDLQRLTKNCKFRTGQIAGLAVCFTANALECFPLNVLPTRWWNRRLVPSGCLNTSTVSILPAKVGCPVVREKIEREKL